MPFTVTVVFTVTSSSRMSQIARAVPIAEGEGLITAAALGDDILLLGSFYVLLISINASRQLGKVYGRAWRMAFSVRDIKKAP